MELCQLTNLVGQCNFNLVICDLGQTRWIESNITFCRSGYLKNKHTFWYGASSASTVS